jgi:hypothetical protein
MLRLLVLMGPEMQLGISGGSNRADEYAHSSWKTMMNMRIHPPPKTIMGDRAVTSIGHWVKCG